MCRKKYEKDFAAFCRITRQYFPDFVQWLQEIKDPRKCAWQEKEPLNRTGSNWMQYIPLLLYSFRWNIEVSYYKQKTFWSMCRYMVRSRKGIEMMVNLINISYCAMKILPYKEGIFSQYKDVSVQEFRFVLSKQVRRQVFYVNLVQNIETHIKSDAIVNALKQAIRQQGYHL